MDAEQIADRIFNPLQEEIEESMDPPWGVLMDGDGVSRFGHERIGCTLRIRDYETCKIFVVTVTEEK